VTKKKKAPTAANDDGTKKKIVRRKKTTKSSSSASNAALHQAARAAHGDLAHSKALMTARKTDPLWYRIEDVLPPTTPSKSSRATSTAMAGTSNSILPEQIQIVEAALAHNAMTRADVTPQAMACLLEQARRYAQELKEDAQDYAAHASGMFAPPSTSANPTGSHYKSSSTGLPEPSARDYILAAEMRPDHPTAVTATLPKLNLLAQQVNAAPLPPIPSQCYGGILLPINPESSNSNDSDRKSILLTARTFDVVSGAHVAQKMISAVPMAPTAALGHSPDASPSKKVTSGSSSSKPGYGALRGQQIPINLKSTTTTTTTKTKANESATSGGTKPATPPKPSAPPPKTPAPVPATSSTTTPTTSTRVPDPTKKESMDT